MMRLLHRLIGTTIHHHDCPSKLITGRINQDGANGAIPEKKKKKTEIWAAIFSSQQCQLWINKLCGFYGWWLFSNWFFPYPARSKPGLWRDIRVSSQGAFPDQPSGRSFGKAVQIWVPGLSDGMGWFMTEDLVYVTLRHATSDCVFVHYFKNKNNSIVHWIF